MKKLEHKHFINIFGLRTITKLLIAFSLTYVLVSVTENHLNIFFFGLIYTLFWVKVIGPLMDKVDEIE